MLPGVEVSAEFPVAVGDALPYEVVPSFIPYFVVSGERSGGRGPGNRGGSGAPAPRGPPSVQPHEQAVEGGDGAVVAHGGGLAEEIVVLEGEAVIQAGVEESVAAEVETVVGLIAQCEIGVDLLV